MAWSKIQRQLAVIACRAAGISEEQRTDMILRNFKNAHHDGDITSTSPALTCADFEAFMSIVERTAGGKLLNYDAGFWQGRADDELARMRHRVHRIATALETAGKLAANGLGLAGWIKNRVNGGEPCAVEHLEYHGLYAAICGLSAFAKQNSIAV